MSFGAHHFCLISLPPPQTPHRIIIFTLRHPLLAHSLFSLSEKPAIETCTHFHSLPRSLSSVCLTPVFTWQSPSSSMALCVCFASPSLRPFLSLSCRSSVRNGHCFLYLLSAYCLEPPPSQHVLSILTVTFCLFLTSSSLRYEKPVILAYVGPSEFLGEVSLLQNRNRSATARCVEDCRLLSLSTQNFRRFLKLVPEVGVCFSWTSLHSSAGCRCVEDCNDSAIGSGRFTLG